MSSPVSPTHILKHCLVYGGSGALGRVLVSFFRQKDWVVTSVDLAENSEATHNVVVGVSNDFEAQSIQITRDVSKMLSGNKLDAVFTVAGGWAGGNIADKAIFKNVDLMYKQSVQSSIVAAYIASAHMKPDGLLTLTGAFAANGPTSGMIAYGLVKAAVHQLTKSLAAPDSGLPASSTVIAILPVTLDTANNRKWMAGSDFGKWTTCEEIAQRFSDWTEGKNSVPSGSLLSVLTDAGVTRWEIV